MREHISTCLNLLEKENIVDQQVRWEYLKYAVRKFSIKCSKAQGKIIRLERVFREKKNKNLQNKILKKKEKNEKSSKITLKVALLKAKFEQIIITTKKPLMKQKLIIIFVLFSNIFIKKHNFLMLI